MSTPLDTAAIKILLVEDSPSDADLLQDTLRRTGANRFEFTWEERLGDALARLSAEAFDVLLLDLSLPDSFGPDTFRRAQVTAPRLPIVVLTGVTDESAGLAAVHEGVQDYLVKGQADGPQIARAIRYAIERKRVEEALESERRTLATIMGTTDVMLVFLDMDFNFVAVNRAYADTCKMSPEQMVGKNHFDLYPNDENEAIFRRVRDTGEPVFYKDKPFHFPDQPDRVVSYWDWSLAPVKDASGKVAGLVFSLRETTKYRKAQEDLRASEERYGELFESMDEGFALCEMIYDEAGRASDFRYLEVNPAFSRLTGLPVGHVVGQTVKELIPGIEPFWIETYGRIVRTGRSERIENAVERLGKHYEVHAWRSSPRHFTALFSDVTQRKRESEKLSRVNRTLQAHSRSDQAIFHATDESAYLQDVCKVIVEDCGHAMVWVGFAENDEEKSVRPVAYSGFEAGYLESLKITWADTERGRGPTGTAVRTGQACICRNMLTDPLLLPWRAEAIRRGYASSIALPLMSGDTAFGVLTIYSREPDVFSDEEVNLLTELANDFAHGINVLRLRAANAQAEQALRESEARFRGLAEAMPQLVWVADAAGSIAYVNRQWMEYAGQEAATAEGRTAAVHPDDLPMVKTLWHEATRTGEDFRCEYRMRRHDGEYRWFLARSIATRDAEGRVINWIGTATDIQELKQAEETLRQTQKLESIGLLAGGIAHDFNNLLVGIIGNASLAEEMLPRANPAAESLRRIIKSGEQAAHLTRQMLAYAGKGRFVLEPVDLSELAGEASGLMQSSISKKISVRLQLEPHLPPVESDPSQMQQIIMNLVLNAAEAIGSDAGVISIRTGDVDVDAAYTKDAARGWTIEPGRYVFLEVRDTGCGMSETTKAKIFDPFFSTKFQGRGLGLAAVAGIVRAHKGAIQVKTAPGAGATFRVLLPAMPEISVASASSARAEEDLRGKGTVLVVDDEEVVRDVAQHGLKRQGYEVLVAASGSAAVDILRSQVGRVQLVVLDLGMPGMSGEETLPLLRQVNPELAVIVSSGYAEAEALQPFSGAHVSGFIQKPYTVQELARKVKFVLKHVE